MVPAVDRRAAIRELWLRGDLKYKLRLHQLLIYAFISNPALVRVVVNCARRFGKTFTVLLYCFEQCIKNPGYVIRYAAPTEKQLRKILLPNSKQILKDCPDDLRPEWVAQDSMFRFPNGSELHLSGTDKDNVEKLRGQGADLVICDEAGSMSDLRYVALDVLLPQTLETDGRMILISTPPVTPAHPFFRMAMEAKLDDSYLVQTINDNTFLTPERRARYMKASGGEKSTTWRREYLCQFVVDETKAVCPEFDEAAQAEIVKEWSEPSHFFPLISLDVGYHPDPAFALAGYFDFMSAKLVIVDERRLPRARTDQIAANVAQMEKDRFGVRPVFLRKTDVDHRLIADMAAQHKLFFSPTAKDDKEAQVNLLRRWVNDRKIVIHPRCRHLIHQLSTTIWNEDRDEFSRTDEGDGEGLDHGDGVDALLYMLRNAPVTKNPFPAPMYDPVTQFFWPSMNRAEKSDTATVLERTFSPKWRH